MTIISSFDWERFLKRWSQELLESLGSDRHTLPPDVIASGWLGHPGTTKTDIAQAETRQGIGNVTNYLCIPSGLQGANASSDVSIASRGFRR